MKTTIPLNSWIRRTPSPCSSGFASFHTVSGSGVPNVSGSGVASPKISNKTLWRWGAPTGGENPWKTLFKSSSESIVTEKSKVPERVEEFTNVPIVGLSAGYEHAAFIVDGQLYTFGNNDHGQLGRTTEGSGDRSAPTAVPIPSHVKSVACGGLHSAAITTDGTLYTWGWSGNFWKGAGALGQGTGLADPGTPKPVQQLIDLGEKCLQVSCGNQHTLVLTESGRLFSTGKGEMGRLGVGSNKDSSDFVEIDTFCSLPYDVEFSTIDCGSSHSIALLRSGQFFVWGRNDFGQLGLDDSMGDMFSHEAFPRELSSSQFQDKKIVDVKCGETSTSVLTADAKMFFFGSRLWLTPKEVTVPADVMETLKEDRIKKVTSGGLDFFFSYALTDGGRLLSWGKPKSHCLGREATKENASQPQLLDQSLFGDKPVVDVACGRARVVALTSD